MIKFQRHVSENRHLKAIIFSCQQLRNKRFQIMLTFHLLYIFLFYQESLIWVNLLENLIVTVFSSDLVFHRVNVEAIEILNDAYVSCFSFLFPFQISDQRISGARKNCNQVYTQLLCDFAAITFLERLMHD